MTWKPALWLVSILVIALDQASKEWALASLTPGQREPLLGYFLSFDLVFNSGAAFSLGQGYTWIMTVIALIATVGLIYFARRAHSKIAIAIFGAAIGGAIGNLIDRLFREPSFGQGHVVDMINYNNYFVGNVADIAVVGAAAVGLVYAFWGKNILTPLEAESPTSSEADNSVETVDVDKAESSKAAPSDKASKKVEERSSRD